MNAIQIKPATISHLQEIDAIGTENYTSQYDETLASIESKLRAWPTGCWIAEKGNKLAGYVLSFPYKADSVFPINCNYTWRSSFDVHYIHDLCVSLQFRGTGVARLLARTAMQNKPKVALTAIEDSIGFWIKLGFKTERHVMYCGKPADYMVRIE